MQYMVSRFFFAVNFACYHFLLPLFGFSVTKNGVSAPLSRAVQKKTKHDSPKKK